MGGLTPAAGEANQVVNNSRATTAAPLNFKLKPRFCLRTASLLTGATEEIHLFMSYVYIL
jgi:hypothetical protein